MTTQTDVRHAVVFDSSRKFTVPSPTRSEDQLRTARQAVLDFEVDRSSPIEVEPGHGAAREARNELERREAIRQREVDAARARLEERQREAGLRPVDRPRAVVVHRLAWIRDSLCQQLDRAGVDVVALHEDGAAGLGCVVAEQPDLLVVEQQLPWRGGAEVIAGTRRFSPATRIAVHLDQAGAEQAMREAGADVAFARPTRPVDMVAGLAELAGVSPR